MAECSLSTEVPEQLLQCDTDSCTDENECLNLSDCENCPNQNEIDGDCSMDDEQMVGLLAMTVDNSCDAETDDSD